MSIPHWTMAKGRQLVIVGPMVDTKCWHSFNTIHVFASSLLHIIVSLAKSILTIVCCRLMNWPLDSCHKCPRGPFEEHYLPQMDANIIIVVENKTSCIVFCHRSCSECLMFQFLFLIMTSGEHSIHQNLDDWVHLAWLDIYLKHYNFFLSAWSLQDFELCALYKVRDSHCGKLR